MAVRRVQYGSWEHQQRETHAIHQHHTPEGWSYYGNGSTVLVVNKRPRQGKAICEVIGEGGRDEFGELFDYQSYFNCAHKVPMARRCGVCGHDPR